MPDRGRRRPRPTARWLRLALGLPVVLFVGCTSLTTSTPDASSTEAPATRGTRAAPVDAVRAVIDALADHPVVAIGESHNLREAGAFYEALVANDEFARAADVVVVEFGNARYQSVVDRYVAGGDVSVARLRKVWQDTTQVGAWDAPMYEGLFDAVREANVDRPPSERLRILLGDPPIDWTAIVRPSQVERYLRSRESFMARLIEREVIDRQRRAVVIAGLAHVERIARGGSRPNVTGMLDERSPGSVFVIGTHLGFPLGAWEQRLGSWPAPSIASLEGTWIGLLPKGEGLAQDAFDAMLYVGPPDSLHLSIPLPDVYLVPGYWETLQARWSLEGLGSFSAEALFSAFTDAGYPGLFTAEGIEATRSFAACMRSNGVEAFPAPQYQYDSVGFYGSDVQQASDDPDFPTAQEACFEASASAPGP